MTKRNPGEATPQRRDHPDVQAELVTKPGAARGGVRMRLLLGGVLAAGAVATVVAVVVALGTVGSAVTPRPSPSGDGPQTAAGDAGTPAPDLTLKDVDGRPFSLGAQRGNVLVIDFLEAGCPTCAAQVPILSETADRYSSRGVKVVIVDLSGLGDRELRDYYRGQYDASRRVVIAADSSFRAASAFRLSSMQAFVVDRRGDITWGGPLDRGALTSALREALS